MARMRFPSCRLVTYSDGVPVSATATSKFAFRAAVRPGVLERLTADSGFGVRERDAGGEWKAYVKKSANERWTSLLKLHLIRFSKASMKDGKTSSTIVSPFMASRSRFIIPEDYQYHPILFCSFKLTHSK